ncbi:hypothetical protein SeMB42_g04548 [Synchytrium endobioticum]|uniref:UBX domain-containing protein 1 n=1 Tax=Synchytrium endobioticum TaxID=286115 RepID=A0A507CUP1_9FUNG|nr:hypothetical protein SeLEV6574_g05348 [Synchytrium endobioticum]TPX43867.1 hypothetical protein SeMB42_g04548 [Synchytrium endobioticum]
MNPTTEAERRGLVTEFTGITGATGDQAQFYLAANNWNLEGAISSFFDNPPGDNPLRDEEEEEEEIIEEEAIQTLPQTQQQLISSSTPRSRNIMSGGRKIATLGDFNSKDQEHDEEDDQGQDYFAGGEKSGVLLHGGGAKSGGSAADLVKDILTKAAKAGPPPESASSFKDKKPSAFGGFGYRLGSEDESAPSGPSVPMTGYQNQPFIAAPSQPPQDLEPVERQLTFWRNGFSIDDGPLRDYNDPENEEFLRAINNGRAPTHLLNVAYGQPVEVKVAHRIQEDYKPPPRKPASPFGGSGYRLGAPVPGEASSASSTAAIPGSFPVSTTAATTPQLPLQFSVDGNLPATSIQIRLADGTRMVAKFNLTHTVGDIRRFINHSRPGLTGTPYVLMTTFPNKELTDENATIQASGLVNSVIMQKLS